MLDYETRFAQANANYQSALERVKTTPPPEGQLYAPGTRVRIADDLGSMMSHFPSGLDATVLYTYAHAYGGDDVKSYCLDLDGRGSCSWYKEHQLSLIKE